MLRDASDHGEIRPEVIDSHLADIGPEMVMFRFLTEGPPVPDQTIAASRYIATAPVDLVNRLGTGRTGQVMRFVVARPGRDESRGPDRLAEVAPLVPAAGAVSREFRFTRGLSDDHGGWTINGQSFDPAGSLADVPLGMVKRWRFATDLHHPVHVNLDPFQVLSRGGREPGPYDGGWKDTVDVRPAEDVGVAVRFCDHSGRYLIHCHNLEHEDMAMMAAFHTR
jgi:spore coat protein A